ncbi:MAG: dephospho-CoA kinase [Actinomycetales bacterium]|nr:dephospho-CoA kinase [Actinomycetales bacterium]
MLLVALTGGIASGKSTIARRLAEHGAVVVDADQVARDVVAPGEPALAEIAEAFGPGVIAADGSLDRAALGAIVFSDPEGRARLNAITHPAVLERSTRLFAEAGRADPEAVVVYDIPLLVEAGRADEFDLVVLAHAPAEVRRERLVDLRGMSPEEADRRIAAQASDAERFAITDLVIDTSGEERMTLQQADALWADLHRRAVGSAT